MKLVDLKIIAPVLACLAVGGFIWLESFIDHSNYKASDTTTKNLTSQDTLSKTSSLVSNEAIDGYPEVIIGKKITPYRYYNYNNNIESSIAFERGEAEDMGNLRLMIGDCSHYFDYIIKGTSIECTHLYSRPVTEQENIIFYYNQTADLIYTDDFGSRLEFTTTKKNIIPTEEISGNFIVEYTWERTDGESWDNSMFFQEIKVNLDTKGALYIESFDFLKDLSNNRAPVMNMEGYNSAEVREPIFVETIRKDEEKRLVYKGTLYFNSREENFSFTVNYAIIIKDNKIVGLRLNKAKTASEYLFKFFKTGGRHGYE